jgi:hypothetical protein
VLYGRIEPQLTDWLTSYAPPPLRGSVGTYAATFASVTEVIAISTINWLSISWSHSGNTSFVVAFASAAAFSATLFLVAVPELVPVQGMHVRRIQPTVSQSL